MQSILLIIFLSFTTSFVHAGAPEKATLKQFLYSENTDQRLQAFNIITSNKDKFRNQILDELQRYATKPDQTPDGLVYLAAIVKDQRYIKPLSKLINNADYSGDHCVYSCPIVLSLVAFSLFTDYGLPALNDKLPAVSDYKAERELVSKISLEPENANNYGTGPALDPLLAEIEPLPLDEVIKISGPKTKEGLRRIAAAAVLQAHITDDQYLNKLYWLAISDLPKDASAQYRSSIHWAIYKAETYRKRKK